MCFSAKASFIVGATLTACGIATVKKVQKRALKPLATAPFWFALQQVLEGMVWITVNNHDTANGIHMLAVYGFIFFASMFWPVYMPWAVYVAEPSNSDVPCKSPSYTDRKHILFGLTLLGCLVAFCSFLSIVFLGMKAVPIEHHIAYDFAKPVSISSFVYYTYLFLYLSATGGALCVSSMPHMWILGVLLIVSCIFSKVIYTLTFASIWCFYGAVGSATLYLILSRKSDSDRRYDLFT